MAKIETKAKPGNDIYTGLLALSFTAMLIGCILLFLDLNSYEGRTPPPFPKLDLPAAMKTTPAAAVPREKKEEAPPAGDAAPKTEPKADAGRPNQGVPAVTVSLPKPEVKSVAPVPTPTIPAVAPVMPKPETPKPTTLIIPEPKPLPALKPVETKVDPKVVQAISVEPVLIPVPATKPAAKPTSTDEPPVAPTPFKPGTDGK